MEEQRQLEELERALDLGELDPPVRDGYVDLAPAPPEPGGIAQALMESRTVPRIYERWWRPALGRIAKGPRGPSMGGEVRLATSLLDLGTDDVVLDVACGPGNFTRRFAIAVGNDGLVVGVDLSDTMLRRATAATSAPNVIYVRASITDLPVRPGSADAVCCFAALHLFDDPLAALDTMTRALTPGGRIALLTSARPRGASGAIVARLAGATGMEMFGRDEIVEALNERGVDVTDQRVHGVVQIVAGRLSR